MGLLLIFAAPLVFSTLYPGGDAIFTWTNNDNNKTGTAALIAYGDTNGTFGCNDTDNGFKTNVKGTLTWTDPRDMNTYVFSDFCLDQNTLVELNCAKNIKVNGVQHQNYMMASKFNCKDINQFSTCFGIGATCT